MKRHRMFIWLGLAVMAVVLLLLNYYTPRENFAQLMLLFAAAWLAFAWVFSLVKHTGQWKAVVVAAIILRLLVVFSTPNLSDDYKRYVWDGIVSYKGMNPYEKRPSEVVLRQIYDVEFYKELNSGEFYTVYPPLSQWIFKVSYQLSDDFYDTAVLNMKLFILLFEAGSIWLIVLLLKHYSRPREAVLWYALNPFVITELTGSLHFEAGMIFFTLLAVWLLVKHRPLLSGLALMAAMGLKLWPLLFIPFFLKEIPQWKSRLLFVGGTLAGLALLAIPFWGNDNLWHLRESLELYVKYFQFNASIYYAVRWLSLSLVSYETYQLYAGYIPLLALPGIGLLFVLLKRAKDYLPTAVLITLFIYLAFATTVHPWYITPLVAFAVLTRFRFAMLWSVLLSLTYIAYTQTPAQENFILIALIYALVFGYLLLETTGLGRRLLQWQYQRRACIKMQRLQAFLPNTGRILDLGCGNGAVALSLKERGLGVTPVDVADRSAFHQVSPVVYDGRTLSFADQSFDTVLLLTVLHHAPDPDAVLREAFRVGRHVVVMEDVYNNPFQKWLTWFTDSLVNLEFWGHPRTNRTDAQWRQTFASMGWQVTHSTSFSFLLFFRQVVYEVQPASA